MRSRHDVISNKNPKAKRVTSKLIVRSFVKQQDNDPTDKRCWKMSSEEKTETLRPGKLINRGETKVPKAFGGVNKSLVYDSF